MYIILGDVHKQRWPFFFDYRSPCVDIFYGTMNVDKKWTFCTTYLPRLVNVVCERPLRSHAVSVIPEIDFLGNVLDISTYVLVYLPNNLNSSFF